MLTREARKYVATIILTQGKTFALVLIMQDEKYFLYYVVYFMKINC